MNRVSYSSVITMLRQFLQHLRQWIRAIWQRGQTKNEMKPCSTGQKVSDPTSVPPHRETVATETAETAERVPDHDSAPSMSATKQACEASPPTESGVEGETLKTPSVHEATQPKKQDTQVVDDATSRDEAPKESATVDYTTHEREPVVEEHVQKHVHTIYQLERTRSNHIHEHFYHIQPIVDTSDDQPVPAADM
ncbi:hypothetical protein E4U53_004974 [Claviceps sorghi]|nr:hypothetical protein E4U53_004974 [Claviceps sorghi]